MQKQIRKRKRNLIMIQISVLLCGALLWYGNQGMFYDQQTEYKELAIQRRVVMETSTGSSLFEAESASSSSGKEIVVEMSAYTSRVEETDNSPCISADGTNICEYDGCVVASNDYEFGTKIVVDGFGECEVKDRMNSRYNGTGNMDIYFKMDLEGALEFGRRQVRVEITS